MKFKYFEINNFKGINHIRLDFNSHPRGNVYTLVGLNESGKTTILEALNFLTYKTERLDPLNLPGYSVNNVHELIPISKRSNFNESIIIEAGYSVEDDDQKKIRNWLWNSLDFELTSEIKDFFVKQSYTFRDSQLIPNQPNTSISIQIIGKKKRAKNIRKIDEGDLWIRTTNFIKTLLPSVLYFPNFLFEFPDKIYLEEPPNEPEKHKFYRIVLQDVLDAIGEHTNLETHVLKRAKEGDLYNMRALDSVLLGMGSHISSTVFENWNRIFKRNIGNKEIIVKHGQDEEKRVYLELRLKDSNELYTISERSLGFRWFFAFLLLTQYRGFRKGAPKKVLFAFDEPASNLHPSAQASLLESFGKFPGDSSIIYTTHSHHMINPGWLEGTFVVKNEGLDYDTEVDSYNAKKTLITLHKYRTFAAQHPNQTTYFQPVLDVLDYSPGKLENVPNVLMLEGKNDFYTLKYFQEKVLNNSKMNLMPGTGAGSLDDVIRLYLAWGREFIVLLDSDKQGKDQKKRYIDNFGALAQNRIFLLEDIDQNWKKTGMEFLIDESDREQIQRTFYPTATKFNKTHLNRAIQESFLTDTQLKISKTTIARFKKVFEFCEKQMNSL